VPDVAQTPAPVLYVIDLIPRSPKGLLTANSFSWDHASYFTLCQFHRKTLRPEIRWLASMFRKES
jgi:hypothetical protein